MRRALLALGLSLVIAMPVSATPAACSDPCEIPTNAVAYIAPVTEIASGTTVRWRTGDTSHPTADTGDAAERCFIVAVGAGVEPVPVRFDVTDAAVTATTAPGTPQERTRVCAGVTSLPGGGFSVPYRCLLHPWMAGSLVIDPA